MSQNRQPKGLPTGGQFSTSSRTEPFVSLIEAPRPYALLSQPEIVEHADGTVVTNHVAEPIADEDGIFAYSGHCDPAPQRSSLGGHGVVPPKAFPFRGSVHARDDQALMTVRGFARSHQEGWDRGSAHKKQWADQFDRRPSHLAIAAEAATHTAAADADRELARRIATADALNDAIADRQALPALGLRPETRRAIAAADAEIARAWAEYQRAYPDAPVS